MKAKQLAMESTLEEVDRFESERIRREEAEMIHRLDEQYEKMDYGRLNRMEYMAGSVVIIGQKLFRNGVDKMHFFRTVLNYYKTPTGYNTEVFVEDTNDRFPERPPWGSVVNHENDRKDSRFNQMFRYWFTGEIVEPIETWWMKEYREWREANT